MASGIYKIINTVNGHFYIGQAANLSVRKRRHYEALRSKRHDNQYLQNAFDKYGEDNFKFEVILYCEPIELTKYEQLFVDILVPIYNICRECVNSNKGVKLSDETKNKMRLTALGRIITDEAKTKMREAKIGKRLSEATKQKMSDSRRGEAAYWFGKERSEETKNKISVSLTGRDNHWSGRTHTQETKDKISRTKLLKKEKHEN